MMASRKAILDKNKQQLLDSVNTSNKIYNNEELSILLSGQQEKLNQLEQENVTLRGTVTTLNTSIGNLTTKLNNVSVDLKQVDCSSGQVTLLGNSDTNTNAFTCVCPSGYQFVGYAGSDVRGDYWTWLSFPVNYCNGTNCRLAGHNYATGTYNAPIYTTIVCMKLNK